MMSVWAVLCCILAFYCGVDGDNNCRNIKIAPIKKGSCSVGMLYRGCTLSCQKLIQFPVVENGERLQEITISGSNIPCIEAQLFSNTPNLVEVKIDNSGLRNVANGTFSSLSKLQSISLPWNPLSEDSITNVLCDIRRDSGGMEIAVPGNQLHPKDLKITQEMLSCIRNRNITELGLSVNLVKETQLQSLFCAGKDHVKVFHFNTLKNLITLRKNIFKCLQGVSIELIRLSNNAFVNISENSFTYLSKLRSIDLSSCNLNRLMDNTTMLRRMKGLRILLLAQNNFHEFALFSEGEKHILSTLESLDLSQNNFFSFKPFSSHVFMGLKTLNISENFYAIDSLPPAFIKNLTSLKTLKLNKNMFVTLEREVFQSNSLQYLELEEMQVEISKIRPNLFHDAFMLRNLSLDGLNPLIRNKIEYVILLGKFTAFAFRNLSKLQYLSLKNINMATLSKDMFMGTDNLVHLDLSHNSISKICAGCINHLSQLQRLHLDYNSIETLTHSQLPNTNATLHLYLSFNCWACDCNLYWFLTLLTNENDSIVLDSDKGNYRCNSPKNMHAMNLTDYHPSWHKCFSDSLKSTYVILVHLSTSMCLILLAASIVIRFRWHIYYIYINSRARVRGYKELSDTKIYQYDAFVSYNKDDLDWVIGCLRNVLEHKNELKLCLHDRDWLAGVDIVDNIQQSIERSRKVVLIITNAFARSNWCQFELTMAQHRLFSEDRDNLVLVMKEKILDFYMTPRLALQMKTQTYIEWDESEMGQKVFWKRLVKAISGPGRSVKNQPIN